MKVAERRYDASPYLSKPYEETHPDRLATIAHLLGHRAPCIQSARVLEIGCGTAGNLVPIAASLPDATFVGFDVSAVQVAYGQALIDDLGLTNITVSVLDIMDVQEDFGAFDYILAHGIYSWVPEQVRDRLITLIKRHLAPDGVAFVSYNTFPGWGFRGGIRDLMLRAGSGVSAPEEAVDTAREAVKYAHRLADDESPWGMVLRSHVDLFSVVPNTYIFHDFMADINEPVWFHEFHKHTKDAGLQYMADAARGLNRDGNIDPQATEKLAGLRDVVRAEQYRDFLENRAFRESLLVHDATRFLAEAGWERIGEMWATARIKVDGAVDYTEGTAMDFVLNGVVEFSTERSALKAALTILAEATPANVAVKELCALASDRAGRTSDGSQRDADVSNICRNLHFLYVRSLMSLQMRDYRCFSRVSARPRAFAMARHMAARGERYVPNLRHQSVDLTNGLQRALLGLLNGEHDHPALVMALIERVRTGELVCVDDDEALITEPALVATFIARSVGPTLATFARLGFLEA